LVITLIGDCSVCPTTTTTTTVCPCVESVTFTASEAGIVSHEDCLGNTYNMAVPESGTYTITDATNCINRFSLSGSVIVSIDSYGPCCTPPPTTSTTSTTPPPTTTTTTVECISLCYNTEYNIEGMGTAEWFECQASSPTTVGVTTGTSWFCHDGSGVIFYNGASGSPTGNQEICGCNDIPTTTTTSSTSTTTTTTEGPVTTTSTLPLD